MENSSDIETRLRHARYLLDDAERSRRGITDAAVRARASSDLASAVALVALAERLEDTNDYLKAVADDARSMKGTLSGVESRLTSIESAIAGVTGAVQALKITIVKVSKEEKK